MLTENIKLRKKCGFIGGQIKQEYKTRPVAHHTLISSIGVLYTSYTKLINK